MVGHAWWLPCELLGGADVRPALSGPPNAELTKTGQCRSFLELLVPMVLRLWKDMPYFI